MFKIDDLNKRHFFLLSTVVFSLFFLFLTPHSALADDIAADDAFCKSKLAGTVSQETCAVTCPGGAADCAVIQTHKASINPELKEDLECYGCTSTQTCYDLGLIYDFPDCINCEMNPFKKCVKAIPIPVVGGSTPLPKDSDGFQCWDCIDDPDTCWKHWLGSTEKTACEAACKKPNHKCVKVGVNPDNGYNCYRCTDMTPPKSCTDYGYIYQAQCNTCPANKPKCVPAFSFWFGGAVTDASGAPCYDCVKGPKTCEEQGLKTKCAADEVCKPTTAPNGAKCCTCEKKPKTCKDYKLQDPPCNCKEGEIKVERRVNATQRKKIDCCECKKDPCHPDLKESDCKECEAKGGKCEPISRVRGKPQCYRCVMPPPTPKSCKDLNMPASCSPNPCYEGYKCEMIDTGHGFKCAECSPDDSIPPPPNHCENHPTHKQPNCAICYNAQMACDTVRLSDNPLQYCAKCLPPIDQRCPVGTIEGYCAAPWCVENLKCVNATVPNKQCHYCVPPDQCAPGRYRTPNCDNKCVQGKEACQRIEGCEYAYGDDPRDVAVIESMNPEDKYCGPDITAMLLASLNRMQSRASNLSDSEKGVIDGTMFLDKNGMSIDLRASPISKADGSKVCPSKPCMAGSMKSVMLCGKCVMEHIGNDILFGFIANQLDVPWHVQLAGAHYAEYTSYGGLDPLASQAAYMMGNDASEKINEKGALSSTDELCSILNDSTLKTGALTATPGFNIMSDEQPFLKDCKPCQFTKTKVLKDFSESDWKLEDGSYDKYTPGRGTPDYCCYGCFPAPTDTAVAPQTDAACASNCDDGNYCNGEETCYEGMCISTGNPCGTGALCDESNDTCSTEFECADDAQCDDGNFCNGLEICNQGECTSLGNPCINTNCLEAEDTCDADGSTPDGFALIYTGESSQTEDALTSLPEFEEQRLYGSEFGHQKQFLDWRQTAGPEGSGLTGSTGDQFGFGTTDTFPDPFVNSTAIGGPCVEKESCPCCLDYINNLRPHLEDYQEKHKEAYNQLQNWDANTPTGVQQMIQVSRKSSGFKTMHTEGLSPETQEEGKQRYGKALNQMNKWKDNNRQATEQFEAALDALLESINNTIPAIAAYKNCSCIHAHDTCCSGGCISILENQIVQLKRMKESVQEARSEVTQLSSEVQANIESMGDYPDADLRKHMVGHNLKNGIWKGGYLLDTFILKPLEECCKGQVCPKDSSYSADDSASDTTSSSVMVVQKGDVLDNVEIVASDGSVAAGPFDAVTSTPAGLADSPIFTDGFESGDTSAWSTGDSDSSPRPALGGANPIKPFSGLSREEMKDAFCDEEMWGYASSTCNGDCPPKDCVRGGTAVLALLGPVTCYYCREGSEYTDSRPLIYVNGVPYRINEIEITYVIIIIETPRGRLVLDKDIEIPGNSLIGFSPNSIMALVKADSSMMANFQKIAQAAGGKMTIARVQDLASMLAESLGKQRKFTDGSFKDFAAMASSMTPPGVGAAGPFGIDAIQKTIIDGPILIAGKKDKQSLLVVLDANGANAQVIPKEQLKKNPRTLLSALLKAESSYQQFLSLQSSSPQGVIQKVASTVTSEIVTPREPRKKPKKKKKKRKGEEIKIEPNDPLYWPDYGKKKSKVKARMKKVQSSLFGSPIKMGGTAMGAGLGVSKKKGSKINDQWGLRTIGFTPMSNSDSAWNVAGIDINQPNTLVAVIDSGFDMSHPDGPQYVWTNKGEVPDNGKDDDGNGYVDDVYGWNFLDNNNDLRDFKGHGTFVAGIIAAKTNNGIGIAGINPGAVIMPLKTANAEGETNSVDIFRAINYAANHGARVINISLGGREISQLEQSAVNRAREKGAFVVVASGNVNEDIMDHGPASAAGTFVVGSLDHDGNKSTISNWGANNGLIAPGEEIYSLRSRSSFDPRKVSKKTEFYYQQSGTSFSTPMVAATAALLLAKNPELTAVQLEDIFTATAVDLYAPGWDGESGAGLLNAVQALQKDPSGLLTIKFNKIQVNKDKRKKFESVDVYGTVRGPFEQFTIEVGKGKRAKKFKQVAGPFTDQADSHWIARIDPKLLRGSSDWILRINVTNKNGQQKTAQTSLIIK